MKTLGILLILILSIGSVYAADEKGKFAVRNAGMVSCEVFLKESQKKEKSRAYNMYLGWIDGYISAANQFTNKTFDLAPWGNTPFYAVLLSKYCEKNPKDPFYIAVNKFIGSQVQNRLQTFSILVPVTNGKDTTHVYVGVLKAVQQILKNEKYYKGAVDGQFGPGTINALKKFQKANKLAETGLPDQLTLYIAYTKFLKTTK